jgi:hypothetical protein
MAACSSRQLRYAIDQRFRTAASVHEFPAKASDEAGFVEIVLTANSIHSSFLFAFDAQQ